MEIKVFQPGDSTVWIPVGRRSVMPGWCFLPWKGVNGAYRWGFKALPEISDYLSALIGIQAAYLADETQVFEVTKEGLQVHETQRRARWRDGSPSPSLLKPKRSWVEIPVDELETMLPKQIEDRLVEGHDAISLRHKVSAPFSERLVQLRSFQIQFRADAVALWGGQCAITGSSLALEAAHLMPVADTDPNDHALADPYNSILLTASLHRLLDASIIGFDPQGNLHVAKDLSAHEKSIHHLVGPNRIAFHPKAARYVEHHYQRFKRLVKG